MTKLSITDAWNEAAAFARRDFGALFTVALAFNALPNIVVRTVMPVAAPGPLGLLLLLAVLALGLVGTIAISALALGRENVVGRSVSLGFRRFLPLLAATLLLVLAATLVMAPLTAAAGVSAEALAAPTEDTLRRLTLPVLALLLLVLALGPRLILMTPVAAAEAGGPIALMRRSWRLTGGHYWKLLGLVLLMIVVLLIIAVVVGSVAGVVIVLLAGPPQPGNLAYLLGLIVAGLVNAAFIALTTTLIARIYARLASDEAKPAVPLSAAD